jgi:hypothetical protein
MFKDCERSTKNGARGLCVKHYVGWVHRVDAGKANWKDLEDQGLVRRLMTQLEKNMIQMKKHKTYNRKSLTD